MMKSSAFIGFYLRLNTFFQQPVNSVPGYEPCELARADRNRFGVRRQVRRIEGGGRGDAKSFLALAVEVEGKLFGDPQRYLSAGPMELSAIALLGRGPDHIAILIAQANGSAGLMLLNSVALRFVFAAPVSQGAGGIF